MTAINLGGIRFTARASAILCVVMMAVILAFIWLAIRHVAGSGRVAGLISTRPFYNPGTFHLPTILTATSVAALLPTAGSTASQRSPRKWRTRAKRDARRSHRLRVHRDVRRTAGLSRATGLAGLSQLRQRRNGVPRRQPMVGRRVALPSVAVILVVGISVPPSPHKPALPACSTEWPAADRFPNLLRAPRPPDRLALATTSCWSACSPASALSLLNYERSAELINFGAFLAFMGVNAAVIRHSFGGRFTIPVIATFLGRCTAAGRASSSAFRSGSIFPFPQRLPAASGLLRVLFYHDPDPPRRHRDSLSISPIT